MSLSNASDEEESPTAAVVVREVEDSVEVSMSEWSSLANSVEAPNQKRALYEQGLYDPGSGEVCGAYVAQSDSDIFRHVYYNYPCLTDPGINEALLDPAPKVIYPDDGQDLYLATCKEMNQCPVRSFHRALLESRADLSYYGVNPNGVRAITKALLNNKTVTVLDLTDNFLNDDACFHLGEMLISNSTLAELNLSGCRIGATGALRLCAGLPTNRALRVLNLNRNQLGDNGVEYFANAVYSRADVREIYLAYNAISGKGVQSLAEALQWNNKLTRVDLSRNNLYAFPSGLANLLEELGSSPQLEYLNLSWNALTGPKISAGIKKVFKSKNLKHLDISYNKLFGTEIVTDLAWFMARPKKMVTYNLSYNPITAEDSLVFISRLLMKACKIQELNMEAINVNGEFIQKLKQLKNMKEKQNVVVTHGYVEGTFKPKGPDPREVTLNRVEYVCKKAKKNKIDIALVILQMEKAGIEMMELKEFGEALVAFGAVIDNDLVAEMQCTFAGPPSKKGAKKINIRMMAEYIRRKWPERQLPPTPPPEPEPEPAPLPEPVKGKGKEGKSKGKGKPEAAPEPKPTVKEEAPEVKEMPETEDTENKPASDIEPTQ